MAEPPPARFHCGEQQNASWLRRAEACARLLQRLPALAVADASIADIGCGDGKLRAALQSAGMSVRWHGYDLHPQADGVVRFDVRTGSLPRAHTAAVLLGVIEYLPDLPGTLLRLAAEVRVVVLSHVVRERAGYAPERLRELGWTNHLTTGELEHVVAAAGLEVLDRETTQDQRTLVLACGHRRPATPA